MKTMKSRQPNSESKTLKMIPVLKCSFIVPTEDRNGVYLIVDEKGREAAFQVDGLGSHFCRRIDGVRSSGEIADELIKAHELPEDDFKEYVAALQKDLQDNGLLSFQRH